MKVTEIRPTLYQFHKLRVLRALRDGGVIDGLFTEWPILCDPERGYTIRIWRNLKEILCTHALVRVHFTSNGTKYHVISVEGQYALADLEAAIGHLLP